VQGYKSSKWLKWVQKLCKGIGVQDYYRGTAVVRGCRSSRGTVLQCYRNKGVLQGYRGSTAVYGFMGTT